MNCTGTEGISAFEFYLALRHRQDKSMCCGPLVYLKLNTVAVETLCAALRTVDKEDLLADQFVSLMSDGDGMFGACAGHWLAIIAITSELGSRLCRHDLELTADVMFKTVCEKSDWDFREMSNFLNNFSLSVDGK